MPMFLSFAALAVVGASLSTVNSQTTIWPDPKTPMPAVADWKDPGFGTVVWIQSPNFSPRPKGDDVVDTIVVHSTVEATLLGTTRIFQRDEKASKSPVSSHFTIGRDGSVIQNVSTFVKAWHAGGGWDATGHKNPNNYTIGIELVNLNDGKDPYTPQQLLALKGIIHEMIRRFPIKQIVSHEFIAQPVGRKNDPKGFPWNELKEFGLPLYYGTNPLKIQ